MDRRGGNIFRASPVGEARHVVFKIRVAGFLSCGRGVRHSVRRCARGRRIQRRGKVRDHQGLRLGARISVKPGSHRRRDFELHSERRNSCLMCGGSKAPQCAGSASTTAADQADRTDAADPEGQAAGHHAKAAARSAGRIDDGSRLRREGNEVRRVDAQMRDGRAARVRHVPRRGMLRRRFARLEAVQEQLPARAVCVHESGDVSVIGTRDGAVRSR